MTKHSNYFPHDYNARGDQNIVKLRMACGWEGYGIFWAIVEKMYEEGGPIDNDRSAIAFSLQITPELAGQVLDKFGLFYTKRGKVGSHSVDRRLAHRREISEKASNAGRASVAARSTGVERPLNECSTINKRKESKEKKEKKERKNILSPSTDGGNHDGFDQFWETYPKKVGKEAVRKAWKKIRPNAQMQSMIVNAVRSQISCDQWTRDGGQFIPHPTTWLNQGRWQDEVESKTVSPDNPKTCESEHCSYLDVRTEGMKYPKDCRRCEAAAKAAP